MERKGTAFQITPLGGKDFVLEWKMFSSREGGAEFQVSGIIRYLRCIHGGMELAKIPAEPS
jgi:hypothetical protein